MYFMFAMPMLGYAYRLLFNPDLMALGQQWSSPLFNVTVLVRPPRSEAVTYAPEQSDFIS